MTTINRRVFTERSLAILGGFATWGGVSNAGLAWAAESAKGPVIGKIAPKNSQEIAASPLGVGFETLDRRLFDPEPTYEPLGRLGVKWARVQTGWCRCETTKGQYDFAWLDKIVDSLSNVGIQPWFNVSYGNRIYSPNAVNEFAVGWTPIHTEETRQAWVRFVRALAEHFRDRIRHWEIWNEPNIDYFWKPEKPSPAGYVELLKLTAPKIRDSVPKAVLIGGGLASPEYAFLQGCMDQGMGELVDCVSIHPYRLMPEANYANEVRQMRDLLKRHKASLELWQGECGCPSTPDGIGALAQYPWNESRQSRWLLRRFLNDLRLNVKHTSWYNAADQMKYSVAATGAPEAGKADRLNFGLLRVPGYTPKPSYFAYQNLCALFDSQTETTDSMLQFAGDFSGTEPAVSADKIEQAAFVRNGCPLAAYWFPADVMKDTPARMVDVAVSVKKDLTLKKPVLVNLLTGEVSRLEGESSAGRWSFSALPLTDYPMLITDAAVALPS